MSVAPPLHPLTTERLSMSKPQHNSCPPCPSLFPHLNPVLMCVCRGKGCLGVIAISASCTGKWNSGSPSVSWCFVCDGPETLTATRVV